MATDETFTITGTLVYPDGTAVGSATVKAERLHNAQVAASLVDSTQYSADVFTATTNGSGVFSITVTHALAATCPLFYRVTLPDGKYFNLPFQVGDSSKSFAVGTLPVYGAGVKGPDADITPLVNRYLAVTSAHSVVEIGVACSDESSDLATGTGVAVFRMPYAMTLTEVRASVSTAPVGSTIIVDINDGGTSIMTTNKLSIDASEKTSTTAATAAGLTDTALADDAEITIDIDQVGSSTAGTGLKVWLIGIRA